MKHYRIVLLSMIAAFLLFGSAYAFEEKDLTKGGTDTPVVTQKEKGLVDWTNNYVEATGMADIFGTFIKTIGDWVVILFSKLGGLAKMIGSGIQKLGSGLLGASSDGFFSSGELHKELFTILGQKLTLAQTIGVTAILGLCLWGVYKLVKWLWNKFKKAEAYVPMFNKQDNKFLVMLKNTSNLNEGLGDFFKESVNKFAKYCIEKGKEVLPKIQEAASKIQNPKLQQFVSEIGPAFSKLIKSPTMKAFKTSASESFETARQNVKKLAPKAKEFLGGTVQGIKQGFAARRG